MLEKLFTEISRRQKLELLFSHSLSPMQERGQRMKRPVRRTSRTLSAKSAEARHCTELRSSPRSKLRTLASLLGSGHQLISQVGVCGSCREHSYGRLL